MFFLCLRIADFIEEVEDEETVDECSKDFFLNDRSDCWKFLPFFTLILTVCELQTLLKMRLNELLMIVQEVFFYIESFLTLFPDNSCEDLQCCFYFPMTLFF